MNIASILVLSVLFLVVAFYAMRFFEREAIKDAALLALFAPGSVVTSGTREYRVLEIDLGFATLQSVGEGDIRIVDLMTPAGTLRNTMTEQWTRA